VPKKHKGASLREFDRNGNSPGREGKAHPGVTQTTGKYLIAWKPGTGKPGRGAFLPGHFFFH
jgi:hypothetical protein